MFSRSSPLDVKQVSYTAFEAISIWLLNLRISIFEHRHLDIILFIFISNQLLS